MSQCCERWISTEPSWSSQMHLGRVWKPYRPSGTQLGSNLSLAEMKYSTIKREALAVKWAVHTLRYYLLGAPFELIMDCALLTWLKRMKDSNTRLTWYLGLKLYQFTVTYRKRTGHANVDFLSWQEPPADSTVEEALAHLTWGPYDEEIPVRLFSLWLDSSPEETGTPRAPKTN